MSKFNAPANATKTAVAKKESASNGIVKGKIQQKKKVEQNSFQIEVSKPAFEPKVVNATAKAQVSKEAPKVEKKFYLRLYVLFVHLEKIDRIVRPTHILYQ